MADIYGTSSNDTLNGTYSDDSIFGLAGDDVLSGGDGHDALMGGAGNDQLWGDAGNDVFNGGAGNDTLRDMSGSDTYVFGVGSGTDTVQDWGWDVTEVDTVSVASGVTPNTLLVTQGGATNPSGLTLRLAHTDDQLIIQYDNSIEQIQFADGTVWDQSTIQARVQQVQTGTAGNDSLNGSFQGDYLQGLGGNDFLYGHDGHDALMGGTGHDTLEGGMGNDMFNGGSGSDTLRDMSGSDTYVFGVGSGTDTVQDWGWDVTEVDTVSVASGVTPNTLLVTQGGATNPSGLTLRLAHTDDQLVIQYDNSIEQIQFADGTVWDAAAIQARVQQMQTGTAGNDTLSGYALNNYLDGGAGDDQLWGTSGHDALMGGAGNDQLWGNAGNDVFNGGVGNDSLYDVSGSDTYVFGVRSGMDTVQDWGWDVTEVDTVSVASGVTPNTLLVTQGGATNPSGLTLRLAHTDDQLVIQYDNSIEQIQFADGTVWDTAAIQARVQQVQTGMEGDDSLSGFGLNSYLDGLAGDDYLWGNSGHDALLGGVGHDQLFGNAGDDVLNGGSGNDQLIGGTGSDTYIFGVGSGTDTVQDWGWDVADVNTVFVTSGVTPNTLLVTQAGAGNPGGLTLRLAHTDDQLVLQNFNAIEQIEFTDGTLWDAAAIQARVQQVQMGTAGNDSLNGSFQGDYLQGLEGDDFLYGYDGHDALMGGPGQDTLEGGLGNDVFHGGSGNDSLYDFSGSDTYVWGLGSGVDTIVEWGMVGDVDTVQLTSGVTSDNLIVTHDWSTNPGGVILRLAQSGDQLIIQGFSGNGIEQIQFADGTVWDQAMIQSRTVQVQMMGTEGNDTLLGVASYDVLQGFGGDDILNGMDGDDVLDGGSGIDTLIGGAGDDRFIVDHAGDVVMENVSEGTDTVESSVTHTLVTHVENLTLAGTTAINGTGNTLDNILTGNGAANVLDGDLGVDTMVGGQGDDTYVVDNDGDSVTEDAGNGSDLVLASVSHTLSANVENLTLIGSVAVNGTGNALHNVLTGNSTANTLTGRAGDDVYIVGAGDVVVEGVNEGTDLVQSDASFVLSANVENLTLTGTGLLNGTGNSLNNILIGNMAANVLDGGAGADSMTGGQGDDTYVVDNAGDVLTENVGEGIDTVQSSLTYTLGVNLENLTLTGTSAVSGIGNSLDNILTGNSAANVLTGGAGNDTYIIGAGDSVIEAVGGGTDTVHSALTYTLGANVENLTLTGSSAINGTGNSLNNVLVGNSVANTLAGGAGNDTYVVGAGDTVVESNNNGTDTIHSSVTWTLGSNLEHLTLLGIAAINGTGNGSANILTGNSANNVLNASGGSDTLRGGLGNDTVNGGGGNDTYLFGRDEGQDLLQDNSGSSDKIMYDSGINPIDLVISRQANDLRLSIHGSMDYVTVQNWYTSSSNRTETIQAGNGQTLLSTQVDQLIQAMASFSQQTGLSWDQAINQQPQQVQSILAASWQ